MKEGIYIEAKYVGADGYGYGTKEKRTYKDRVDSLKDLTKWVQNNLKKKFYSGFNVTTILTLQSYKAYEVKLVNEYEQET